MRMLIAILVASVLLYSCAGAPKHFAKAIAKDKPYVAEQTRLLWPCITTASDTVSKTDTLYDLVEAECPPVQYVTTEGKTVIIPGKTTFVQGATVYRDRVVTLQIKDSTDNYLHSVLVASLQADVSKIQAQADKYKGGRNWWRKWCLITWGIIGLGGAFFIIKKRYL